MPGLLGNGIGRHACIFETGLPECVDDRGCRAEYRQIRLFLGNLSQAFHFVFADIEPMEVEIHLVFRYFSFRSPVQEHQVGGACC